MSCDKKKYFSFQEARKHLAIIILKGKKNRREKMFYYCEECGCWHLTHKTGRKPVGRIHVSIS